MPELPEVETVRRSLDPLVRGRRVCDVEVRCAALRRPLPPDFGARLEGSRLIATSRRAKYLLLGLDSGQSWIVHLGMSGRLLHQPNRDRYSPATHDHVIARLDDGAALVFNDPRRFGLMVLDDAERSPLLADIGPEPLDRTSFHRDYLAAQKRRTRRTIKDVLMDQHVVAGLGNIYVNEILFLAGVRPRRRMPRVTTAECERIVDATRSVISEAIEHRGSSISDFLDGIGRRGGYQWRRRVYDRADEPCAECSTPIKCIVVGQRSSFYCASCQR